VRDERLKNNPVRRVGGRGNERERVDDDDNDKDREGNGCSPFRLFIAPLPSSAPLPLRPSCPTQKRLFVLPPPPPPPPPPAATGMEKGIPACEEAYPRARFLSSCLRTTAKHTTSILGAVMEKRKRVRRVFLSPSLPPAARTPFFARVAQPLFLLLLLPAPAPLPLCFFPSSLVASSSALFFFCSISTLPLLLLSLSGPSVSTIPTSFPPSLSHPTQPNPTHSPLLFLASSASPFSPFPARERGRRKGSALLAKKELVGMLGMVGGW